MQEYSIINLNLNWT